MKPILERGKEGQIELNVVRSIPNISPLRGPYNHQRMVRLVFMIELDLKYQMEEMLYLVYSRI